MRKIYLLTLMIIIACAMGGVFRYARTASIYKYKYDSIVAHEEAWNRLFAKNESIIIETGDINCYDTFYKFTTYNEGLGTYIKRRQVLPSIIMANKYEYGRAFYETYRDAADLYTGSEFKGVVEGIDTDKVAGNIAMDFLSRGCLLGDDNCNFHLRWVLRQGIFTKKDSALADMIYCESSKNK